MGVERQTRIGIGAQGVAVQRGQTRLGIDLSEDLDIVLLPGDLLQKCGVKLIRFLP